MFSSLVMFRSLVVMFREGRGDEIRICCNKVKPHASSGSMTHGVTIPPLSSLVLLLLPSSSSISVSPPPSCFPPSSPRPP